jgi:pSer/pThr/pTyr-binding forkhead associated (FHA) protein
MEVRLVIEQGKTRTRSLLMRKHEGVIGRERGCTFRIPSMEVSRRHCVLRTRDGYVTVEDLKSSNGTQLNGENVSGVQVVRPGDRLRVGPVTFVVEYQLTPEAIDRLLRGEVGGEFEVVSEAEPEMEVLEVLDKRDGDAAEEEPVEELEVIGAGEFQLPETDELRNILGGLEEDPEPAPKKKKKKR